MLIHKLIEVNIRNIPPKWTIFAIICGLYPDMSFFKRTNSSSGRWSEKLPFCVGGLLVVSAAAFALLMFVASIAKTDVDFTILCEDSRVASVKSVEITPDSQLVIPATVGYFWDKYRTLKVENHAYESSSDFTSLVISEGVEEIGYSSFYGCKNMRSVVLPKSLRSISDGAFYGCSSLEELTLPPYLESMGEYVFERCTGLSKVVISDGIMELPRSVFCGCESLTEVSFPISLVTIEPLAFKDCVSLTEVVLPSGLLDLGGCAFEMCTSLRRVVIPQDVRGLGVTAFNGCENLVDVECLATVPPPLGTSVFDGISKKAVLHVPAGCVHAYKISPWAPFFADIVEL